MDRAKIVALVVVVGIGVVLLPKALSGPTDQSASLTSSAPPSTTSASSPTVPTVLRLAAAQAKSRLNALGLDLRVIHVWSLRAQGAVVRQHPDPGTVATADTVVTLAVSDGLPIVPKWINHSFLGFAPTPLRKAKQKLKEQHLKVRSVVYAVNARFWHDKAPASAGVPHNQLDLLELAAAVRLGSAPMPSASERLGQP
jgi:hypothetical protein